MPFVSLNGTSYHADIYKEGYTGNDIITLRAAGDPFETQEDNKIDLFKPVRTQTGYMRIVYDSFSDEYDWHELVPINDKQHYVELVTGGQVVWCGYMKAEQYTQDLYGGVTEYEFPLICPLTILEGYNEVVTADSQTNTKLNIVSVHAYIAELLGVAGVTFNNIYFQADAPNLPQLFSNVQKSNWMEINNDYSYQVAMSRKNPLYKSTKDNLEILQDICVIYGWSLHVSGKDLYFIMPDGGADLYRCTWSQLPSLVASDLVLITGGRELDARDLTYISNDHKESVVIGASEITITAKYNKIEHCLQLPLDDYKLESGDMIVPRNFNADNTEWYNFILCRKVSPTDANNRRGPENYTFKTCKWEIVSTAQNNIIYNDLMMTGITNNDAVANLTVEKIALAPTFAMSSYWNILTFQSHEEMYFNDGYLSINAKMKARPGNPPNDVSTYDLKPNVVIPITLKIGDKYFNGTSWQSTETTFGVWLLRGRIVNSKQSIEVISGTCPELPNGFWIYFPKSGTPLKGKVQLKIDTKEMDFGYDESVPTDPLPNHPPADKKCRMLHWDEWNVDFAAYGASNALRSSEEYYEFISDEVNNPVTIDLDLHSFSNSGYTRSVLLTADCKPMSTIAYTDETTNPEIRLLARMVKQLNGSSFIHTIEVENQADFASYPVVVDGDYTYAVTSLRHKWVNDNVQIRMNQIKTS